jgi:leucyl-tRNA synthetase
VTFLSIAPENAIVSKLTTSEYKKQVAEYVDATKSKTDLNRKDLQKDKTGVFTGSYVINPISNEKIPVYVADYVLNSYATGIVMGVPGHDQRDYEFAQKYHLPVKFIIETQDKTKANEEDGKHINSRLINGKNIKESSNIIIKYLEEHRLGHKHVSYKLND